MAEITIAICDNDEKYINIAKEGIVTFAQKKYLPIKIYKYTKGKALLKNWEDKEKWTKMLFVEMDMDDIDGMSISEILRNRGYEGEIIFYTKDKLRVFESFDIDPFHYILKDVTSSAKCFEILEKAVENISKYEDDYMTFSFAGKFVTVRIKDIQFIEVNLRVCTLHYEDGKTFEFYSTLDKLTEILQLKGFTRVNRYVLANMAYIKKRSKSEIEMRDGNVFKISRYYKKEVLENLDYYFATV